ncbi:hypothetical protein G8770_19800 [Aestuariicella hydrocarbonica]|uniref:Uncharacterized protein n=1 Tax=Pseudomaricurvus hydrocarbonicus TaxID=1470433 RepID=A0A9E5MP37_9GAMM|nr:hypothetical protein [Aestuariicella hydrocarbonica]NHO67795.1 hypothetical protein [Aestuariicella hydrocarbonica]
MARYLGLFFLLVSAAGSADDRYIQGKVVSLSGSDLGIHVRLNTGKPLDCKNSPGDSILVKPDYIGALYLAPASLGKQVGIFADFDPLHRECVAKDFQIKSP